MMRLASDTPCFPVNPRAFYPPEVRNTKWEVDHGPYDEPGAGRSQVQTQR
jgi:hypothetical protein